MFQVRWRKFPENNILYVYLFFDILKLHNAGKIFLALRQRPTNIALLEPTRIAPMFAPVKCEEIAAYLSGLVFVPPIATSMWPSAYRRKGSEVVKCTEKKIVVNLR